ncbi:energy-coupling factor transporter transmembrane protein EcfT [Ruoffia tabacinasalis]|uniref:Energy-coupling factor transporter transmembrane protein EcfT n=1 Tax=Ruoffia tabacinasalis TaxID=87458 RepID=A0A5R9E0L9_9LACT|nr:energy-coupling factor transporter transmembrane component T [Ruoffia tabacinasalis]TLQ41575.1 energy-coupling factor transporter transmembrane protein EcfT [Ruoffia tabacinasalis]
MFDKLLLGRYLQGNSIIHELDPRTKLLGSFFFIVIVFLANHWLAYLLLAAFVFFVIKLSNISISYFLRGIRPMLWIIMFTVIFQMLFTVGGTVYFQLGPVTITSLGVINAIYIFMRLVLIIMMSTILTLTTAPLELTDGIEHLLRPLTRLGFPSHEVALLLSIALRYVPTLMDEAQKIMNAQRARGVEFDEGSFIDRVKAMVPILIPLFVSAFNRADEMAIAMEARGYRGGEGRTKYRQLKYSKIDAYALLILLLVTAALIAIRIFIG